MVEPRSPEQTAAVLTAVPRTATSRHERPRWRRSQRAGEAWIIQPFHQTVIAPAEDEIVAVRPFQPQSRKPRRLQGGLFLPGEWILPVFFLAYSAGLLWGTRC